jgi:hypothetical protein
MNVDTLPGLGLISRDEEGGDDRTHFIAFRCWQRSSR